MSVLTCRFYSIYIEIIVSVKYSWYSRFFYSNSSQSEHRFNCLTNGRDEIRNSPHFTQKHWYLKTQTWCNTCRKLHQISQSPTQWSPLTTPWQIELRGSARTDNSICGIAEFCVRSLIHPYLSELTHASSCKVHVSLRCNKRMTIHEQHLSDLPKEVVLTEVYTRRLFEFRIPFMSFIESSLLSNHYSKGCFTRSFQ